MEVDEEQGKKYCATYLNDTGVTIQVMGHQGLQQLAHKNDKPVNLINCRLLAQQAPSLPPIQFKSSSKLQHFNSLTGRFATGKPPPTPPAAPVQP